MTPPRPLAAGVHYFDDGRWEIGLRIRYDNARMTGVLIPELPFPAPKAGARLKPAQVNIRFGDCEETGKPLGVSAECVALWWTGWAAAQLLVTRATEPMLRSLPSRPHNWLEAISRVGPGPKKIRLAIAANRAFDLLRTKVQMTRPELERFNRVGDAMVQSHGVRLDSFFSPGMNDFVDHSATVNEIDQTYVAPELRRMGIA